MIVVEITKKQQKSLSIFKFGRIDLGVRVLSFHDFGNNLSDQLKTRYDDALGEKWKGNLWYKRFTKTARSQWRHWLLEILLWVSTTSLSLQKLFLHNQLTNF